MAAASRQGKSLLSFTWNHFVVLFVWEMQANSRPGIWADGIKTTPERGREWGGYYKWGVSKPNGTRVGDIWSTPSVVEGFPLSYRQGKQVEQRKRRERGFVCVRVSERERERERKTLVPGKAEGCRINRLHAWDCPVMSPPDWANEGWGEGEREREERKETPISLIRRGNEQHA